MRRAALCVALLAAALPARAEAACPAVLRVGFFDYELAPLLTGTDKSAPPQGKAVEWVRQAVAHSGCHPTLSLIRLPINRGRESLTRNEIDIWAVAFPGPELLEIGALPLHRGSLDAQLGFYSASYSFYVASSDKTITWDGQTLSGPAGFTVGVSAVPALRALSREKGWTVEPALDTQAVLNKLVAGRSSVALLPDLLMATQPPEISQRIRRLPAPALTSWYYSVASKDFFGRHADFMRGYWFEMCKAGRAEQHDKTPCREP